MAVIELHRNRRPGVGARGLSRATTEERLAILAVDTNRRNLELLMMELLDRAGYRGIGAMSLEELDQVLQGPHGIALALVDVAGFDQRIWTRCDLLRRREIPFLVISPRQLAAVQETSLAHGAQGVLVKPLATKELSALVRTLLEP